MLDKESMQRPATKKGLMPNLIQDILAAKKDGMSMVLTATQVRAFSASDQCEEYATTLGTEQFAVIRLLWSGGERLR